MNLLSTLVVINPTNTRKDVSPSYKSSMSQLQRYLGKIRARGSIFQSTWNLKYYKMVDLKPLWMSWLSIIFHIFSNNCCQRQKCYICKQFGEKINSIFKLKLSYFWIGSNILNVWISGTWVFNSSKKWNWHVHEWNLIRVLIDDLIIDTNNFTLEFINKGWDYGNPVHDFERVATNFPMRWKTFYMLILAYCLRNVHV